MFIAALFKITETLGPGEVAQWLIACRGLGFASQHSNQVA